GIRKAHCRRAREVGEGGEGVGGEGRLRLGAEVPDADGAGPSARMSPAARPHIDNGLTPPDDLFSMAAWCSASSFAMASTKARIAPGISSVVKESGAKVD
ncbi:MAG TPA: hypothetical protein VL593_03760, partial [Ramlibacter sp.]|nr:hypothetical protein [Ramlibacter sp.]